MKVPEEWYDFGSGAPYVVFVGLIIIAFFRNNWVFENLEQMFSEVCAVKVKKEKLPLSTP